MAWRVLVVNSQAKREGRGKMGIYKSGAIAPVCLVTPSLLIEIPYSRVK